MSLLFDDASSQYLSNANAIVSGTTLTMACWFNTNDITISQVLFSIGRSTSTEQTTLLLVAAATGTGVNARLIHTNTGGGASATTTTEAAANGWHHAIGLLNAGSKTVQLDAGGSNTNAIVGIGTYTVDRTYIARRANNGVANYHSGLIAEAGLWDVVLVQSEIDALAKGFSPTRIRPASLKAYYPLLDQATPSIDPVGRYEMTWNAGPTVGSSHPAMFGG